MSDTEEFQNDGGGGGGGQDGFLQFLNTTDSSSSYTIVNASNPLEWAKLAQAFFASLVGGIALGIQYGINGLVDGFESILGGMTRFVYEAPVFGGRSVYEPAGGLVPTVRRGLSGIYNAALQAPKGLGWLTWPAYVVMLLVALYIVVWTLDYAREEVL
jgi:hypothetical protein